MSSCEVTHEEKRKRAVFLIPMRTHFADRVFAAVLCHFAVILYLYDLPADPVLYAALLCAAVGLLSFILS